MKTYNRVSKDFFTEGYEIFPNIIPVELIQRRKKLIPIIIIKAYEDFSTASVSFNYKDTSDFEFHKNVQESIQEIYIEPIRARPPAYCFANFS